MEQLKAPPHNLAAEQSVLGALMIDQSTHYKIIQVLKAEHFYNAAHKEIYENIKNLAAAKKGIDLVTVTDLMEKKGTLDECGGFGYIAKICKDCPSAANVMSYVDIVIKDWNGREIIAACQNAMEQCLNGQDYEKARHGIYDHLEQLFKDNAGDNSIASGNELVEAFIDELDRACKSENGLTGWSTGDKHLDNVTGGLQPGDYCTVAARSGAGKTTFALNRLAHFVSQNRRALFFSMEMKKSRAMMKLCSDMASVPFAALKAGNLDDYQWAAIDKTMQFIKTSKLHIDDSSGISIEDIERKARQLKAKYGELDLIVLDYVQRIKTPKLNMYTELTDVSNRLKDLFMELGCAGIVLAQLKKNSVGIPKGADLRETGAIENDSDVIMFLHTDSEDLKPHKDMPTALIFDKVRYGETGIKMLRNELDFQRFTHTDEAYQGEVGFEL